MTAKTKHGHKAHRRAHGSDEGSTHERLNRMHAMPNRAEGQPMSAASGPEMPEPSAPPMGAEPSAGGNPFGGPSPAPGPASEDDEEGDQT